MSKDTQSIPLHNIMLSINHKLKVIEIKKSVSFPELIKILKNILPDNYKNYTLSGPQNKID